jgi:hypothetical protein
MRSENEVLKARGKDQESQMVTQGKLMDELKSSLEKRVQ